MLDATNAPAPAPTQTPRDARLSLLKVIGSMGVVLVHTSMHTLNARVVDSLSWWLADLGNTMGRNMSSLFAMVAGAVLLGRLIEANPSGFVRQRLARLLPAVLVWSAFYFAWRAFLGETMTWTKVAHDLAYGMPYFHLWFLFAMLGVYVLMPGFRLLVRDPDTRSTQYFCLVVLAVATCLSVTATVALGHWPTLFISYTPLLLVYLVAGYLWYRDQPQVSMAQLGLAGACCVLGTMAIVRWLEPGQTVSQQAWIQGLRAPLALGWVLVIFLLVMRWHMPPALARFANRMAPTTLGVYALHPFWIDAIHLWAWPIKQPGMHWLVAAPVVYVISAASSWAIGQVPRLRALVS